MSASAVPRASSRARRVAAQSGVELTLTVRRGESLLVAFGIPLIVLVFFARTDLLPVDGPRADFLVPGVVALAIMSTAMVSLGIATGFERSYGVLKRLGSTPLARVDLIGAKAVSVLAIEAVQVPALLGIGALLGARHVPVGVAQIAAMVLGTVAFAGVGLLMAGTLRAEANLAAANGLYLVLLLIGGMAFDPGRLPQWLWEIGRATPAGALAEALRASSGRAVGTLAAWAVAMPAIAAVRFRWE